MGDEVPIRVLIVDDHTLLAESLSVALRADPGLQVDGIAATAAEASRLVRETRPDIVLLDHRLPDSEAPAVAADILSAVPTCQVLVMSGHDDEAVLRGAVDAGCTGVVYKSCDLAELVEAVKRAHRGEAIFNPRDTVRLVQRLRAVRARARVEEGRSLTPREVEILTRLAMGITVESIAGELFISPHTVRTHVRNMMGKLGAHTMLEAVAAALRLGLVEVDTPAVGDRGVRAAPGPPGRIP